MSGHSKWHNIQFKKGKEDAKRGKIFSNLTKLIRVAVKESGTGDPKSNPTLRILIEKARAANLPKEKIQKAIDCGLGKSASGQEVREVYYEAFGPSGVGMILVGVTDNLNRTISLVKSTLSKYGGSLGSPNSVKYMFTRNEQGDFVPTMKLEPADAHHRQQLITLLEKLREIEDLEDIYTTANIEQEE